MLSILIPTYSCSIVAVVKNIHSQLLKSDIDFEIVCFDDGSKSSLNTENETLNNLSNTRFHELPHNIGRSAIRNQLAKESKYSWLLFLDADVMPTSNAFISNYLKAIQSNFEVCCGGIMYDSMKETRKLLRYSYGKKHEEISVEQRKLHPNKYFFTANFLIHKTVFNQIQFDEKLTEYGYEDLVFSKQLSNHSITIQHVDNPVFHLGIDSNEAFVYKSKKALLNLKFLLKNKKIGIHDTQISKRYVQLKPFGIIWFLEKILPWLEWKAIHQSSLLSFQLFRLGYLGTVMKDF